MKIKYYKNIIRILKMNIDPRTFRFLREGVRTTHDEKFFGLFSLVLYIHVVIFSILNIYIVILGKKFKTFYLVLYYVYIVFLYSMFPSISLYPIYLYSIIYTYAFLLFFYCRILSDINGSLSFLLPKHNQFFYNI